MEVELEYEEEVECPHCHKMHTVKGIAWGDIEPPW